MVPKFRGWDNRYKEYIKNVLINSCGKVYFDDDVATQDDLDIHIEKSTGMKDANGKEIYEGDILATASRIGRKLITDYLKVDWREDYAGFFCGEKPLYVCLSEWNNDIKYPQTFPEIVGNVHTDGDLIDG
ncbi:YopX family protein [Levilactobacillus brevis]|uniref:YopX family protein n=1 Tax=Levilactobacillus brevis TaxID=1580 RepID=UPI003EB9E620